MGETFACFQIFGTSPWFSEKLNKLLKGKKERLCKFFEVGYLSSQDQMLFQAEVILELIQLLGVW